MYISPDYAIISSYNVLISHKSGSIYIVSQLRFLWSLTYWILNFLLHSLFKISIFSFAQFLTANSLSYQHVGSATFSTAGPSQSTYEYKNTFGSMVLKKKKTFIK
jgi:hypothetical protein